jgi:putative DNA primase/helicase
MTSNPRRASNISEAALFRVIEKFKPTLMLDEAETLKGKSERAEYLRQILNAGNRQGAVATRCIGQGANLDVKDFSVFCPKIVCGIGTFPPTIADRAICVPMQRRNKQKDRLERFSSRPTGTTVNEAASIQGRVSMFIGQKRGEIEAAYGKTTLDFLGDRDADSWAPLFAIIAVADFTRLSELRACAESLTGAKADDAADESLSLRLLSDLRIVWPESEPHVFSEVLKNRLRDLEDGPWGESEIDLSVRKLARMLKGFKLHPATVRIGETTKKGYSREAFEAASTPYLVDDPSQASQPA